MRREMAIAVALCLACICPAANGRTSGSFTSQGIGRSGLFYVREGAPAWRSGKAWQEKGQAREIFRFREHGTTARRFEKNVREPCGSNGSARG